MLYCSDISIGTNPDGFIRDIDGVALTIKIPVARSIPLMSALSLISTSVVMLAGTSEAASDLAAPNVTSTKYL